MLKATRAARILIDGKPYELTDGITVAAALDLFGQGAARLSVSGQRRTQFCGVGVCHECRVTIDARRRLACQALCREGLQVVTDVPAEAGQ